MLCLSAVQVAQGGSPLQFQAMTGSSTCAMQVLHPDLLNDNFTRAEYAVRGELYLKGEELRKQGREVIFTNGETSPRLVSNNLDAEAF
jgi:hypothetical protein